MTLAPGTRLGPYSIEAAIGAGGMGEVYRARDTRLDRSVAVKVLTEHLAQNPDARARFEREAKALARLAHPSILAIYDFGCEGDITYAVTELLEGETLAERLAHERLPWRKAAEMAAAIADGLAAAHGHGIVHRDLKPSNLFLTVDGRVKILDFGLATSHLVPTSDAETRLAAGPPTMPGAVLGTTGYMAPEQVRGERADHRADIFALGCVLYEMLAGQRAFARPTVAETMAAILQEPAPEVKAFGADAHPELSRIVGRCLGKQPGERFQSASDLAFSLRSLVAQAGRAQAIPPAERARAVERRPSIAVLPFANLSADPEQEYFCDGVAEEITADLSKLQGLRVISRSSTIRMKGTQKDVQTIGRELGVRYVLEGSVRKGGNRLRITAQLIDTHDDTHLWAEKYDGNLGDVFDIQEKVARSVVEALRVTLSPEESQRLGAPAIDDVRAYECYLKARTLFYWTPSEDSLAQALELLDRGLAIIGDNDRLYATKGAVYLQSVNSLSEPPETFASLLDQAQWCATKALSINPNSSAAQYLQAFIFFQGGKPKDAIDRARRAIALDPNNADAAFGLGYLLVIGGSDLKGARRCLEKAAGLDPLTPLTRGAMGWLHLFQGNFRAAVEALREWQRELEAISSPFLIFFVWAHAASGNYSEALRLVDQMARDLPGHVMVALASFLMHALRGEKDRALSAVTPELEQAARWDDVYPLIMAESYAAIGELERAFQWLEHAINYGITNVPFLSQHDPFLVNLRSDARFAALMEKARYVSGSREGS